MYYSTTLNASADAGVSVSSLDEIAQRIANAAPPLTPLQRAKLRGLLSGQR
ncbi:hypothetical protein O7600_11855 [Micromonospora sp. WMMA1998]|uniref:hypothetical protein n=1 Tax=Micromonospora sp. WMMA1998 TaxID=3015167 RepID=UPI00248BB41C|nr:hypothetical protein [Micromonospora sp. WMMA1998]WBC17475.1 hypothetical protein O7600_11855 [Micromonospora sp. WMMA1998]